MFLHVSVNQKCIDYIEKWPFMVIFQYNLYIFGISFDIKIILVVIFFSKASYNI